MDDHQLQNTPEWEQLRCGKLTASRYSDAVARTKTGWGASREAYMAELVAERLSGLPYAKYVSPQMRRGSELQPRAQAAYEFDRDVDVVAVGFIIHPTIAMSGCSPDGFIGEHGLIEIKCPDTHTHVRYLLGAATPNEYFLQIQWQLACTGRQWCDWVSWDDRLPLRMQMLVRRIERDPELIETMEREACEFLAELDRKCQALEALYGRQAA